MPAGFMSFSMDELRVIKSALLCYMSEVEKNAAIHRLEHPGLAELSDKEWRTARGMYETLDFVLHDIAGEEYTAEHQGVIDDTIVGQ